MKRSLFFMLAASNLILFAFSCGRKDSPEPDFRDPPANYRLSEITTIDSTGSVFTRQLSYNALGRLEEENNVYDSLGNLVHSDWPGRPYTVRYVYNSLGLIDSIVTIGHIWDLTYVFHYTGLRLDRLESFIFGELHNRFFRHYISTDEVLIYVLYGNFNYRYVFDKGHSPYPEEYRLKYGWFPFDLDLFFLNRNINTIVGIDRDGRETVTNFQHEYNEYGYPVTIENLSTGRIRHFKYETF